MRILAVDDDPVILELLRSCLGRVGEYELTCCDTAEAALKTISSTEMPFDCFLLDIMLPGVDGIEMCKILREKTEYRTTPVLMVTASREPTLMQRAFEAGATDFISKPLDGMELGARVNSAGMLNASLLREREAQHTLAELTALTKLKFDEGINLGIPHVSDLLSLENHLLRLPAGCYAMSLFSLDVVGLRAVFRSVRPAAFRQNLEQIAHAAIDALQDRDCQIAYAGSGRFVGIVMGRARMDNEKIAQAVSERLQENWEPELTGVAKAPAIRVESVTSQRVWSGLAASNKLREYLNSADPLHGLADDRSDNLFERMQKMVMAEDK
ncbi:MULTISPECIES: response regulator [unclassified Sulfitobacter]|uniref:response regulator n=1 Tax=unclassified Sulfitobacter TaxID=196795 RepID=UPI0007C3FBFC|nr:MULTISPECIES: response regulator [unclassified Sulfitobacter]KZX93982.1 diguanylate cyclase [Sulfitobacter sp. HI0023]KZY25044.1 diguanylate cyclase [Sulfitobacter sp. HI0040]KZZ70247.1 diguanylate cyclase [Sulfitobacter sp. HI0129]